MDTVRVEQNARACRAVTYEQPFVSKIESFIERESGLLLGLAVPVKRLRTAGKSHRLSIVRHIGQQKHDLDLPEGAFCLHVLVIVPRPIPQGFAWTLTIASSRNEL